MPCVFYTRMRCAFSTAVLVERIYQIKILVIKRKKIQSRCFLTYNYERKIEMIVVAASMVTYTDTATA